MFSFFLYITFVTQIVVMLRGHTAGSFILITTTSYIFTPYTQSVVACSFHWRSCGGYTGQSALFMMVPSLSFHSKNVKKTKIIWSFFQDQILLSHLEKSCIPSSFAYHFLTAGVMLLLFEENKNL